MNEIKCFGINIPLEYYKRLAGNEIVDILKRHDGTMAEKSKKPIFYCATLLFFDIKQRNKAYLELGKIGINAIIDFNPIIVDKKVAASLLA